LLIPQKLAGHLDANQLRHQLLGTIPAMPSKALRAGLLLLDKAGRALTAPTGH
jgi:hypothetical protein